MESIIYVNNNNNVETYLVNIDMKKIFHLKKLIDEWNGKGELIIKKCGYLPTNSNVKREIVSKKQIDFDKKFPKYEYKYYEYTPHTLSLLCEKIIKINLKNLPLEFSSYLRRILEFECDNEVEERYLCDILTCFSFKKINTYDIVKSNIDLSKKISLLNKIKYLLTNIEIPKSEFLPQSYINLIEERLNYREIIVSNGLYQTFKYSDKQKNDRRIRALNALPKDEDLKKYKLIK